MKNKKLLSTFLFMMVFMAVGMLSCDDEPVSGNYNLEITALTPDSGFVGTTVYIAGSGFAPTAASNKVTFHNTPAQVIKVEPGRITTKVPDGATTGPVEISVGTEKVVGPSFTVLVNGGGTETLSITSIQPNSGYVGTEVTILGSGFDSNTSRNNVTFNGVPAEVIKVEQGDEASLATNFKNIAPDKGNITRGASLDKLQGENMQPRAVAGNTAGADSTFDKLIVKVPNGATSGPVQITTAGQTVTGPNYTVITEGPAITGINPASGPIGTIVTITGSHFSATASSNIVKFNGTPTAVTGASTNELIVAVPVGATDGPVTVSVGGKTAEGPDFDVNTNMPPIPVITKIDPASGQACSSITITGANFSAIAGDNTVMFGSETATVSSATTTELTVTVPPNLTAGSSYEVTVTVNGQKGKAANQFTVTGNGCSADAPVISGISPTSGPVGTEVTINGSNFSSTKGDNLVKFNGTTAVIKSATENKLVVIVPAGATDGTITVTVNGQTDTGPKFDVTPAPPTITKVDPLSGKTCSTITITGTNFSVTASENIVEFNGTQAGISSASTTQLVVTVPAGATDGKITVTVNGQTATSSNFDVTGDGCSTPAPSIAGINPTSGTIGITVTITGANFSATASENIVKFNGTQATVTSASATELVVEVPAGATDGKVTVMVNGQTATGPVFDVTVPLPAINKVSPLSGETCSQVTITGLNFSATATDNEVAFNGTQASIVSASATTLVVMVPSTATDGKITVTVNGLTATGPVFHVTGNGCSSDAPTISGINPATGPIGTQVTITGTNFNNTVAENTVKFGSAIADVLSASTTQLVAVVPYDAPGHPGVDAGDVVPVSVTVNSQTAVGPDFTVIFTQPVIKSIEPDSGIVGTTVRVIGEFPNYLNELSFFFNGTEVAIIHGIGSIGNDEFIEVQVPAGATTGPVKITAGSQSDTGPVFTVLAPKPVITNVNPASGKTCTDVTITGSNFSAVKTDNMVKFNGEQAMVKTATTTELVVTVPAAATDGPITVTVNGQTSAGLNFDVTGDGCSAPAPTITNINPASGVIGTQVTITGTNFSTTKADNAVAFNGTAVTVIQSASTTQLVVEVPAGATDGAVTVTVNGQTATGPNFDVTPPVPVIVSLSPASGKTCTDVTISGSNFSATTTDNMVKFNGEAAVVKTASTSQLVVTVPAAATDGPITVTVNGQTTTGPDFDVTGDGCSAPAPTITNINPASGVIGTQVTITGTNFSTTKADNAVAFNGTAVTVIQSASATQLVVEVPAGATDGAVTVTVNGQTATGPNFDVTPPVPVIVSLSPASGKTCTDVTITGSNFSAVKTDNMVKFNGEQAMVKTATTTELVVTVPAAATDGPITVTVNGQTTTGPDFDVTGDGCTTPPPAPTITAINPTSGPIGTEITITGTNFSTTMTDNIVRFNGTQSIVKSANATELVVDVPSGATTGEVTVTVGANTATGPVFTVTVPMPSITAIVPTVGAVGTEVTITGTNFSATPADNTVTFNGTTATVKSATTTQLVVDVPTGATTGEVKVTVNGKTATGPVFTVLAEGQPQYPIIGPDASVEVGNAGVCLGCKVDNKENIVDLSLSNYGLAQMGAGVAGTVYVSVTSIGDIPAGGEAGFVIKNQGNLLGTDILDEITITTYLDGVQQEQNATTSPLELELLSDGSGKQFIFITTTKRFDEIKIEFGGLVSAGNNFEVYAAYGGKPPAPTISSMSPVSGIIGTQVTLSGFNFSDNAAGNTVKFGTTTAAVTNATATQLSVDVPGGLSIGQDYDVTVTVLGETATAPDRFTVTAPPVTGPAITAINPTAGPVGTEVTITGINFSATPAGNAVAFNGTSATVKSATATELVVDVPPGATDGAVTVTVGGETATGPNFDVSEPDITGIAPTVGAVGTEVTITGTNFSATPSDNTVTFNGTPTTVKSASTTQLVVDVPTGATTGQVEVTVYGFTATGPDFTVLDQGQPQYPIIGTGASVEVGSRGICVGCGVDSKQNIVDLTLNNFGLTQINLGVGGSVFVSVTSAGDIPAGGQAGFVVRNTGNLIGAGVLNQITITTYLDGVQQEESSAGSPLKLSLLNGSTDKQFIYFTTTKSFDEIEIDFGGLVSAGDNYEVYAAYGGMPPAPTITAINPTSGPAGTTVIIDGTGFSTTAANNTVKFNGTTAAVNSASVDQLNVTVPSGATDGPVTVTANGQTATGPNFDVTASAPTIGNISPTSGPVGTEVTITGTNFSTTAANNVVEFNGTAATVKSATATELVVDVPSGATDGTVTVTVNGQTATGPNFDVTPPVPTITNVNPLSGQTCTDVTITGTNFSATPSDNTVTFNGTTAVVTSATTTQLVVTVPDGATDGSIKVTVNGITTIGPNFDVTGDGCTPPPTVTGINPTSGTVGTTVTITGTNFSSTASENVVKFNGTQAAITSASQTELVVTVPIGATDGPVTITVNGQTATGPNFDVTLPVPTISGINPTSGTVGTTVTITGTNFSSTASENVVKFNGTQANVTSASQTELVVTVPAGATDGTITVTTNGQTATGPNFDVTLPPPTITNVSPTSGPIGTEVTITGTNFSTTAANNVVEFNGTAATVKSATATELVVDVPTGATDGTVTVTVNGQTATGPNFDVTASAPTIGSISPTSGPVGTQVTITGTNFSTTKTDNAVAFNGTAVTVIQSASATQLVVEVPAGATDGAVTVTVNGQTATGPSFDVTLPAPTITSLDPVEGPVGTTVEINGTNFNSTAANNTVKFGTTVVSVTSATTTQLVVDIPITLQYGNTYNVTVTVGGQTTNAMPFDVTRAFVGSGVTVYASPDGISGLLSNGIENKERVIDSDPSNYAHISATVSLGGDYYLGVKYSGNAIPSGGRAGFVIQANGGLLDVSLLGSITVTTYDENGNLLKSETGNTLLSLGLTGGQKHFVGFETTQPFSEVRFTFDGVAIGNDINIYGAYGDYPDTP